MTLIQTCNASRRTSETNYEQPSDFFVLSNYAAS